MDVIMVRDYLSIYLERSMPKLLERDISLRTVPSKATTIIGPRRAGKTSIMLEEIAKHDRHETVYLDFEDISLKGISATDALRVITEIFTEVSGKKARFILLDEVQNVADWQTLIRTLLDRGYTVYATGSSSKLLSKEIATQLRGRSASHLLLPFSFAEFLRARGIEKTGYYQLDKIGKLKNLLEEYMISGGFPEIVLGMGEKDKLLAEYKDLIFLKDFVERQNARSIEVARHIFNFVTQGFASEMSVRKVLGSLKSNGVPFGRNTVYDYVEKLQDTMIFFFLGRYSTKASLRSGWPKKVYLADNGLAWRLPMDRGRLMENLVFLHLKRIQSAEPSTELYYYRDSRNYEVDFVVKNGTEVKELLQVTYASGSEDVKDSEIASLAKIGEKLRCRKLTIITWDYENRSDKDNLTIHLIPLWKWLLDAAPSNK